MPWASTGAMLALASINIVYVAWVLSLGEATKRWRFTVAAAMAVWLGALHVGLSNHALFPEAIGGVAFLGVIFGGVALVAGVLFVSPVRALMLALSQEQLMLLQGIRVFFGATFLMQAATGVLPAAFGIVDGFTHTGAGFLGLVAAYACASGHSAARRAWFANLFGLADILIVASTLALVLLPEIGPHHAMMYAVFLPAPLWVCFHMMSVWRLLSASGERGRGLLLSPRADASQA